MITPLRAHTLALGLALALAALASPGGARAETRTLSGQQLVLTNTLTGDTIISTDPSLSGAIRVSMDDGVGCLSLVGGETAVIATSGCSDDSNTLRIDVPPHMPLTISSTGDGTLRLGDTLAPVVLTLTGSGDVTGGRVGRLVLGVHGNSDVSLGAVLQGGVLEMTGSGDVRLASLNGELVVKHQGSGDLAIGHIEVASADLESTGSGDMLLGGGLIGTLVAHLNGHGDLAVAATVHNADVSAHGGGDVKLGPVTGTLNRSAGGGSDIYVGGPEVVDTVIAQVAKAVGSGKSSTVTVDTDHHSAGHFFTFIAVCIMLYIGWRIVRRGRGGAAPMGARAGRAPDAPPSNPGVATICATMSRLEERLGRVEYYVTSREFDLQQKFRKL
jgi:hypothetical protein